MLVTPRREVACQVFDPSEEPIAVVPHDGICAGGRPVRAVPTATEPRDQFRQRLIDKATSATNPAKVIFFNRLHDYALFEVCSHGLGEPQGQAVLSCRREQRSQTHHHCQSLCALTASRDIER